MKGDAAAHTRALLAEKQPLEVVDEALIPALDIVGAKYEKGTLFLPQLLQAASAAQSAFEEIKTAIAQKGEGSASKGRIVLATVKGDVHDIGKNIVRVILENYGFEVLDLGRDVPVETVVDTVREKDVHLVGLSALMTTTLKSMEETIAALHAAKLDCKIMVGGAVLTPEYAEKIGADWYAKDAKRSADIAKEFFGVYAEKLQIRTAEKRGLFSSLFHGQGVYLQTVQIYHKELPRLSGIIRVHSGRTERTCPHNLRKVLPAKAHAGTFPCGCGRSSGAQQAHEKNCLPFLCEAIARTADRLPNPS